MQAEPVQSPGAAGAAHGSGPGSPSRVIHIRNVGPEVSEEDLLQLVRPFGEVAHSVVVRSKNQALLEMRELQCAISAVQYYGAVQASVRGRNLYLQFSAHQELKQENRQEVPNRILLVTVSNTVLPVTIDVVHQVFSPHGLIEKIVMFNKTGNLQVLVQYSSPANAVMAKQQLQAGAIHIRGLLSTGHPVFKKLTVNQQTDRSRDYTSPLSGPSGQYLHALQPAPAGFPPSGGLDAFGRPLPQSVPPNVGYFPAGSEHHPRQYDVQSSNMYAPASSLPTGASPVLLVSGLNVALANPDTLFNLFSIYGNIVRIKMLHNKPDHALVQMGDVFQAQVAINCLQGITLFGARLSINFSKHPTIMASSDTKEYSASPLNRFTHPSSTSYRHTTAPCSTLHASNLPPDIALPSLVELISIRGRVTNCKLFEVNGKKQALIQMGSEEDAVNSLALLHGTAIGRHTLRLAFSKNTL
eukprot:jgi/Chlat1/5913/Chrsp4S06250